MSTFTGMDIAQVRDLSVQMRTAADQITQLSAQLTSKLGETQWVGNDRTQFESDWNGTHVANLRMVSEALSQACQAAERNANEQEQTSNS